MNSMLHGLYVSPSTSYNPCFLLMLHCSVCRIAPLVLQKVPLSLLHMTNILALPKCAHTRATFSLHGCPSMMRLCCCCVNLAA